MKRAAPNHDQLPLFPRWHVCDRLVFVTGAGTDHERPIVVLRDEATGEALAFYRSTGWNGGARRGEWCPLYGLAFRLGSAGLWFVKHADRYKTLPCWHPWAHAGLWLATVDLDQLDRVELDLEIDNHDVATVRRAAEEAIRLNDYMRHQGAPFRHPDDAEAGTWARWRIVTPEVADDRVRVISDLVPQRKRCA